MSSISSRVSIGFDLCESLPDFVVIVARFCWNLWFLLDLIGSQRDLGGSWRDLNKIRLDLEEIEWDLEEIRPNFDEISTDQTKSDPLTTPIDEEQKFQCVFRSSQLKIGFSCSNPSTNLPILGFRGEDPLPIVADVSSAGFQAGLGGLVRCQV